MIFSYFDERYHILKYSYLSNYKISYGVLGTLKIENKLSPSTPTAIDLKKHHAFKKVYQEYLERLRIAHNIKNDEYVKSFNPLTKQILSHKRDILGYGFNKEYGVMDTTGTASGLDSKKIKEKALLELIEKNEGMLIWYADVGYNILIDEHIESLISSVGIYSEEIFIFCSKNLCNLSTFLVILLHQKEIIATGISVDVDTKEGLKKALLEAKLLESFYRDTRISPYNLYTKNQHKLTYEFILELSNNKKTIKFRQSTHCGILLKPWITSIEFAVLNTKGYQEHITIRCFSKELLNSLPGKENMLLSMDKYIFEKYRITKKNILDKPPSIIL